MSHFFRQRVSSVIFAAALAVRLVVLFGLPAPADLYDNEMHRAAKNLATRGTLADPYRCQTGPTAHVAPGYAAVLATIYRTSSRPEVWIGLLTSVVSALTYALLPWLGSAVKIGRSAGIIAGFFGAVFPWLPGMEARGAWEAAWAAFLLVAAAGLTARGRAVAAGFTWGIAFLFAPALLPIFVVMLAFKRRQAILTAGIAIAVVSPWLVRNYVQFDHLFWIRSNLGLELVVSNNPNAVPYAPENLNSISSEYHPASRLEACAQVQSLGEARFMDTQMKQAIGWIEDHPVAFGRLAVLRAWYYWVPPYGSFPRRAALLIITILSLLGIVVTAIGNQQSRGLFFGVALVFPLTYYLIQADPRYRAPIQPVMLLAVGEVIRLVLARFYKPVD